MLVRHYRSIFMEKTEDRDFFAIDPRKVAYNLEQWTLLNYNNVARISLSKEFFQRNPIDVPRSQDKTSVELIYFQKSDTTNFRMNFYVLTRESNSSVEKFWSLCCIKAMILWTEQKFLQKVELWFFIWIQLFLISQPQEKGRFCVRPRKWLYIKYHFLTKIESK